MEKGIVQVKCHHYFLNSKKLKADRNRVLVRERSNTDVKKKSRFVLERGLPAPFALPESAQRKIEASDHTKSRNDTSMKIEKSTSSRIIVTQTLTPMSRAELLLEKKL